MVLIYINEDVSADCGMCRGDVFARYLRHWVLDVVQYQLHSAARRS